MVRASGRVGVLTAVPGVKLAERVKWTNYLGD
jgi:hypothetical protein